jgi:hypothetical protein
MLNSSLWKNLKVYGSRGVAGLENIDLDMRRVLPVLTLRRNHNAVGGVCFRNVTFFSTN